VNTDRGGGMAINFLKTLGAPAGTISTESNPAYKAAETAAPSAAAEAPAGTTVTDDWPSYNRTLSSDRFSPLSQDAGGNFYAFDSSNGQKLWNRTLDGAVGGGVITYMANGAQKVAVAYGFTHPEWPTIIRTAKITVLGLDEGAPPNQ
jgi:outer membrane protein assembly factor BamB